MLLRMVIAPFHADRKNFSQYGGWIVNAHQGRTSMYTRDREGIVEQPLPVGVKPDVQAASCNKHLLFGHGPHLADVNCWLIQFKSRDFDTVTGLAIDQKVKSKIFLDPHYDSKTQSVLSSAQLARSHGHQGEAGKALDSRDTLSQTVSAGVPNAGQAQSEYLGGQTQIKRYGDVENLIDARKTTGFKFYNDFTKRFDQTHLNSQLRAPHYLRH